MEHEETSLGEWLRTRLTTERAEEEWCELLRKSVEQLIDEPLSELLPPDEIERLLRAWLRPERIADAIRPVVRLGLTISIEQARTDEKPIGRWVPQEAKAKILDLVGQKDWVHESWVHELFQQKAMEELVADTLYRALREFSTIVPRVVQSLTPKTIGKLARLGGRATGGMGSRFIEEVEKRLEIEIKKFLERGTKRALEGAARFAVQHIDDPVSVQSRRQMTEFLLGQTGAFHVHPMTQERIDAIDDIASDIARYVGAQEEATEILHRVITGIREEHGEKSLREWLAIIGVTEALPYQEWASATWPVIQAALRTDAVKAWIDGLAAEIEEQVRSS